jgi:hypothetical protein
MGNGGGADQFREELENLSFLRPLLQPS